MSNALMGSGPQSTSSLKHDAEKCERFSGDIHAEQDSDFRPTDPKIILF
ncbi:hypothetical protein JOH51_004620 [Rhizobium leguminosarum]|nr:hypothetical protein [Rhizobium leguminosarum]